LELRVHITHLFNTCSPPPLSPPRMQAAMHETAPSLLTFILMPNLRMQGAFSPFPMCLNGVELEHILTQVYLYLTHCTRVRLSVGFPMRRLLMKHRAEDFKESRNAVSLCEMLGRTSTVSSSHKNEEKISYKNVSGNKRVYNLIERLHSTMNTVTM